MRHLIVLGWLVAIAAMLAMVVGHLGSHDLDWRHNQISTYAAVAPYDALVTAAMVLSAAGLSILAILATMHQAFGRTAWAHVVPLIAGAAAAGLLMLAAYEETAPTLTILQQSDFWSIRRQSFHDAGLLIFFYGSVLLVMLLGSLAAVSGASVPERIAGALVAGSGPAAFLLMTTGWATVIGLDGPMVGLQQRASLFCLWLAMICLLAMASRQARA